jgi:ankyrin repeat protein
MHDEALDLCLPPPGPYLLEARLSLGAAALSYATFCGFRGVADYLITTHGQDVNVRYHDLAAPLYAASGRGHAEVVHLLLQHNADVNDQCPGYLNWTPLHSASNSGHAKVVELLLEHGADVNALSMTHSTPVFFASQGGHLEAVRLLLGHGADVHIWGRDDHTPLQRAVAFGRIEVERLLLEHGALTE